MVENGSQKMADQSSEQGLWVKTEFKEPERFAFKMRFPFIGGSDWSFVIEPTPEGCRVTQTWVDQRTKALVAIGGKVSGVSE